MSYHAIFMKKLVRTLFFGNNYDGSHMIHGHTKVTVVPINGFKQSTSPEGSIIGKDRIIRHNPNYY